MAIQDWKSLQKILEEKQTGVSDENPYILEKLPGETDEEHAKRWKAIFNPDKKGYAGRKAVRDAFHEAYTPVSYADQISPSDAYALGYGKDKRDLDIPFDEWIKNPQEYRANAQSAGSQLANGFLKMIPYAASTFIDNTIGLVGGLAALGDSNHTFIDNPVSRAMQGFREWADDVMPNYRTEEELNDQDRWWRHLNANFWGDSFMKNLGFTIGAGASGAALSSLFAPAKLFNAPGKVMSKAYRAAVKASKNGDAAATEAFKNVLRGAGMDVGDAYKALSDIEIYYNKAGAVRNFIGSVGAAVGESRTEALQAAKEFHDAFILQAKQDLDSATEELQRYVTTNKNFLGKEPVYDGYGNQVGTRTVVNADGLKYYDDQLAELQKEYDFRVNAAESQGEKLANQVFWMNMPLLSISNAIMFGRLFSGGFSTQAKAAVKGSMKDGFRSVGYTGRSAVKAAEKSLSEGFEELFQKMISEGTKNAANRNMAAYHNLKYDPEAIEDTSNWVLRTAQSMGSVASDASSWQEFAIGALTGALGMPAKGGVAGGIAGAIQENRAEVEASQKAAEELNKAMKQTDFRTFFDWMNRDKALEKIKDVALKEDNRYAWHGANDAQMLNYVMAFARAGRLNELENAVDSMADLNDHDIDDIKSTFLNPNDPDVQNMTAGEILKKVKTRAEDIKKAIKQYRRVREGLDFMSLGTSDPDVLDELTYTRAQMENFEARYQKIIEGVLDRVRPVLTEAANEIDKKGNPTDRAKKAQELLNADPSLRTIFGDNVLDIERRIQENPDSPLAKMAYHLDAGKRKDTIQKLEDLGVFANDNVTKEEISDLIKLIDARQDYYAKFFNPTFRQKFDADKKTDEAEAQKYERDAVEEKAAKYFNSVKNADSASSLSRMTSAMPDMDDDVRTAFFKMIRNDSKLGKFQNTIDSIGQFGKQIADELNHRSGSAGDTNVVDDIEKIGNISTNIDSADVIDNFFKDSPSLEVAVARYLVSNARSNGIDERAIKLLEDVLNEKLGDIFKSQNLGTVKQDTTPGKEETNPDTTPQVDILSELISGTTNLNDTLLNKILDGDFSDYPDLTDDQKQRLSAEAKDKQQELMKADNLVVTKDEDAGHKENRKRDEAIPEDMPEKSAAHQAFFARDTNSVRGAIPGSSLYNISKLSGGGVAEVEDKTKPGTKETVNWMNNHGVYQFLDSGALGEIYDLYAKDGKKMPVFFIANPHYEENNLAINPFAVKTTSKSMEKYGGIRVNALLAIEINDENRDVIKKYEDVKLFSSSSLIEIDGKQYQVIGQVWNPTPEEIEKKPEDEKKAYNVMRDRSFRMEELVRRSVFEKYNADKAKGGEASFNNEGKWYVADIENTDSRLYTTLNYITPGWNDTRKSIKDGYEQIPLSESLGRKPSEKDGKTGYRTAGKEYHFLIQTDTDQQATKGAPSMPMEINAPAGSLWMATKRADGSWGWTYITIARTGEVDFDAIKDTELMKDIRKQMDILFAPVKPNASEAEHTTDFNKRLGACRALEDIFYLGTGNHILFHYVNGGIEVNVGDANESSRNAEDMLRKLKDGNYRFQVSTSMIAKGLHAFDKLIDAGILSSEMRDFIRKGSMVGVNFLNETGVVPEPEEGGMSVSIGDEIGRRSAEYIPGTIKDIRIGDDGYQLNPDGTVQKMGTGEPVTDITLIAQTKAIGEAMQYRNNLDEYPGKAWLIEKEGQYTQLFERDVDGITIRMHREGTNGAVLPIYDDARWNSLVSNAELQSEKPAEEKKSSEVPQETKPEEKKESPKKRKPVKSIDMSLLEKANAAKTVKKKQQEDEEKEDTIDCG